MTFERALSHFALLNPFSVCDKICLNQRLDKILCELSDLSSCFRCSLVGKIYRKRLLTDSLDFSLSLSLSLSPPPPPPSPHPFADLQLQAPLSFYPKSYNNKLDLFLQASCKKKLHLPLLKNAFFKGGLGGGGVLK